MIDIQTALYNILHGRYGRDVRQSIHDGMYQINEAAQKTNAISDVWTSRTYSAGEYCIYNNTLYRCKASCTNVIPTNTTYWESTKVGSELSSAKSELSSAKRDLTEKVNGANGVIKSPEMLTQYSFDVPTVQDLNIGMIYISNWNSDEIGTTYVFRYRTSDGYIVFNAISSETSSGKINSMSYSDGQVTINCNSTSFRFINWVIFS